MSWDLRWLEDWLFIGRVYGASFLKEDNANIITSFGIVKMFVRATLFAKPAAGSRKVVGTPRRRRPSREVGRLRRAFPTGEITNGAVHRARAD